jgi:hypothetical protein
MRTRWVGKLGMAAIVALGTVLISSAPAQAADTSFQVSHVHAGGAGATAVSVKGNIEWLNRSVRIYNIQVFVNGGECGHARFNGYQINDDATVWIDEGRTSSFCPNRDGWRSASDITLDAQYVRGGITHLVVEAIDDTHFATTPGTYRR